MKRIIPIYILIFIITFSFTGCSSGSENQSENNTADNVISDVVDTETLEGTWAEKINKNGIEEELTLALNEDGSFEYIESITENNKTTNEVPLTGNYEYNSETLTLRFNEPERTNDLDNESSEITNFTYKLDGNTLKLEGGDGSSFTLTRVH